MLLMILPSTQSEDETLHFFFLLPYLFLLTKSFLNDHFVDFISFYKEVKETL